MKNIASHVELCIKEVQEIYETIETVEQAQDGVILDCIGGYIGQDTPSDSESSERVSDQSQCPSDNVLCKPGNSMLLKILTESKLNWF